MRKLAEQKTVGRFAPSPSGRMHLGNVWACLLAWLAARSAGGAVVLRLEDLDPGRCRPEYCDQVMRDLEWLGLGWDGEPVYQSRRTQAYAQAFQELERQGLVYSQRTSGRFVTEDREMIETAKSSLAAEQVRSFLDAMARLGYMRDDILRLIEARIKEENGNGEL